MSEVVEFVDVFGDGEIPEELPKLNVNQLTFVKLLWQGTKQEQAYRQAYDKPDADRGVIASAASRLCASPRVKQWLDYGRSAVAANVICTKESHLAELARLSASAELAGNYGAAVHAEISRGKVAGLYVDRKEFVDLTKGQIIEQVRDMLGEDAAKVALEVLED